MIGVWCAIPCASMSGMRRFTPVMHLLDILHYPGHERVWQNHDFQCTMKLLPCTLMIWHCHLHEMLECLIMSAV